MTSEGPTMIHSSQVVLFCVVLETMACGVEVAEPRPVAEAAVMPVDTRPPAPQRDVLTVARERAAAFGAKPPAPSRPLTTAELERLRAASPELAELLKDSTGTETGGNQ